MKSMNELTTRIKAIWTEAFKNKWFLLEFFISLLSLVFVLLLFSKFTFFVEARTGFQFNDPLLRNFEATDLTKIIFLLIYGGMIFAVISLLAYPYKLTILFEAYALMVCTRLVMMYILPLAPPFGMIILEDPFVEFFGTGKTLLNDLFFSGHTASVFMLYLAVPKKAKPVLLIVALLVPLGVLLQKVHYTVDVLVAPYISFCSYYIMKLFFYYRYKLLEEERL